MTEHSLHTIYHHYILLIVHPLGFHKNILASSQTLTAIKQQILREKKKLQTKARKHLNIFLFTT